MQAKGELIFKDVRTACMFAMIIYGWNTKLLILWISLFVFYFGLQILAHQANYKLNNRFY
jgi:hypothetical protein